MLQDIRFAFRSLARTPGFTAVIILTLALGMGVNTAIFSVLNGVLFRPLDYDEPDRVMTLWESSPQLGIDQEQVAGDTYRDWRDQARSFESMAAYRYGGHILSDVDEPERISTVAVSPSLFRVLGVVPALGRTFTAFDDETEDEYLAILSHGLWARRFGSDTGIIDSVIRLDDNPYTVVGVMPQGFEFPPDDSDVAVWTPLIVNPRSASVRAMRVYNVVGRLTEQATPEQARAELDAIAAEIARQYPDSNKGWGANITSAHEQLVGDTKPLLAVLGGAAGLVLLIGCVNITNLMLARSSAQEREFAIRATLGAGRHRLIRRSLVESLTLAGIGGTVGLIFAFWGVGFLRGVIPDNVPRLGEIQIDLTVLAFTAAASLIAGLLFGLVPAVRAMRPSLSEVLQEGGRGAFGGRRSRRLLDVMVAVEVALALLLLVGAGLLIRSFSSLLDVDPGFRTTGVVTVALSLPESTYPDRPSMVRFFNELVDHTAELPGVEAAGAVTALPMSSVGMDFDLPFQIPGLESASPSERPRADYRSVIPGYFSALGIPLVRGRLIDDFDREENRPVMVINETMAELYFADVDPIGRILGVPMAGQIEIIGVVGDVRHSGLGSETRPEMFVSYEQFPLRDMHVVAYSRNDPDRVIAAVREQIATLDPGLPITSVATMEELISGSLAQPRFNMVLLIGMAACALALAGVGIYGVTSYSVGQRTNEIGIRMALGADAGHTMKLVVSQALLFVLAGVALGAVGSFGVNRLITGLLFGVTANDPTTLITVVLLLLAVASGAAFVPARRATRVDPIVTLRRE